MYVQTAIKQNPIHRNSATDIVIGVCKNAHGGVHR